MKKTLNCNWFSFRRTGVWNCLRWAFLGILVAGCSEQKSDKLVLRGSNTIGEELAPRLIEEYRKTHPGVVFDLEFKGSTYGFGALMVDRCDIAAASRPASTNDQVLAKSRGVELSDHVIGAYSVAVIVKAGSPVSNLTTDQVRDVFTGAVQNWKDVGGPDAPIHLFGRDLVSGTHLGFQELALGNKPYGLELKTFPTYTQLAQAVASDANGIGYVSLNLTSQAGVKAVSIGGVAPSVASVNGGKYPYARVLRLYTNKPKETSAARDFIQFVQSARGQEVLTQAGFIPHP